MLAMMVSLGRYRLQWYQMLMVGRWQSDGSDDQARMKSIEFLCALEDNNMVKTRDLCSTFFRKPKAARVTKLEIHRTSKEIEYPKVNIEYRKHIANRESQVLIGNAMIITKKRMMDHLHAEDA